MDPGKCGATVLGRANPWSSGQSSDRTGTGLETDVVTDGWDPNRRAALMDPGRDGPAAGTVSRQADIDVDNTTRFRDNRTLENAGSSALQVLNAGSPLIGAKAGVTPASSGASDYVTAPNDPSDGCMISVNFPG